MFQRYWLSISPSAASNMNLLSPRTLFCLIERKQTSTRTSPLRFVLFFVCMWDRWWSGPFKKGGRTMSFMKSYLFTLVPVILLLLYPPPALVSCTFILKRTPSVLPLVLYDTAWMPEWIMLSLSLRVRDVWQKSTRNKYFSLNHVLKDVVMLQNEGKATIWSGFWKERKNKRGGCGFHGHDGRIYWGRLSAAAWPLECAAACWRQVNLILNLTFRNACFALSLWARTCTCITFLYLYDPK